MITVLLAMMALTFPVMDMKGKRIEECEVRAGDGGTLTLMCRGNEPFVLDYKVKPKEGHPKFRVERNSAGKVTKVEIRPAKEVNWRPVAYAIVSIGAVLWGGKELEEEQSVSAWNIK